VACPAGITDNDERKIWEVKSKALFDSSLLALNQLFAKQSRQESTKTTRIQQSFGQQ